MGALSCRAGKTPGVTPRPWIGLVISLAVSFFQYSAFAEDPDPGPGAFGTLISWTGATSNAWGINTNWSTNVMPGSTEVAAFNGAFTNQPTLTTNRNPGALYMTNGVAQNVTISGAGTLTIQGATTIGASSAIYGILIDNTSAFTLSISAPTKLGNAQTWANNSANLFTVSGAVDTNGQTLTIDGTGNTTISGVVSGGAAGSVTKNGTGTLTFTGSPNTYGGVTTVNGGTLVLSVTGSAIPGTLTIGDGVGTDTVLLGASNQIANKAVTINSSGVLDLNNNSDAIGGLTMTGGLVQSGTGTFTLGNNVTTNANATSATITGNFNLGGNRTFTVADGGAADDLLVSANIASSGANLTKQGAGRMVLSGSNDLHDVQISAGILTLRNSNALGSTATPTVNSGATMELEGGITINNALKLSGSGTSGQGALVNVSGNNTYSGAISLAADTTIGSTSGTLTISGNLNGGGGRALDFVGAGDTMFTGVISNLNNGLTMDGTGTLSLFGVNTYNSSTTINSGTVQVNSSASLGQAGNTATINAGTLEVTSTFSAARNFILGSSTSTVQVDPGVTFTVGPTNTFSGTGTLNKTGDGTLFLSGANTYTGGTNITAGTVQLGANQTIPSTGPVTISGGSTLDMQTFNDTVGLVTLQSGSIIGSGTLTGSSYVVESGSASAPLAGTGTMTKNTTGTVTLSGNNTFTGSTTVNGGTLTVASSSGSALGSTSSVTVNSGGTLLLGANNQINNTAPMTLAGGTFAKGNFSEGTTSSAGVGALTLTAPGSHIDFGTGTVGTLSFSSFTSNGNILTIDNWTGTAATVGTPSTDRLIFDVAPSTSDLANFSFTGYGPGAFSVDLGNGFFEVVPVPEPSTWIGAGLSVAVLGFSLLRRRRLRAVTRVAPILVLGIVPLFTGCGSRTTTSVAAKILAVEQPNASTSLRVGQQFFAGQTCRLSAGQEVTLAFTPGVMAQLRDDANIGITRLRLGRDGNETGHDIMDREIEIRCLMGSIIGSVPADALKTHFIIHSEAGTVSVEPGSVFYLNVSDSALRITCPRGTVRFTAPNSAEVIIVPPGKWLVHEKGATTRPEPQPAFENARAQQEITLALEADVNMQPLLAAQQRAVPSWRHL